MARPKIGQKRSGSGQLVPVVPRCLLPNLQQRDFRAALCSRVRTRSEECHSNVHSTGTAPDASGRPKKYE